MSHLSDEELAILAPFARQYPTLDSALARIARLEAVSTLRMGTVHVISDVHGEHAKLRHVINNASGMLRPFIEKTFAGRLSPDEIQDLLKLLFYPRETLELWRKEWSEDHTRQEGCRRMLGLLLKLVHELSQRYSLMHALRVLPADYRDLYLEVMHAPKGDTAQGYHEAILNALLRHDRALHVIRLTVHVVRDLTVQELIIAGDCWDRGPRGDLVVDYMMKQPNLSFIWGNHDAAWLGACLGHLPLIAHVLRISMRYRRLTQLEEGYAIPLLPLEDLARTVYGDDPAECYRPHGQGPRDTQLVARMQKAAAIMQFKLEGQMIARNPGWKLDHRRLLHRIDLGAGTLVIDGKTYPLRDRRFPTLDPARPYELSPEEQECMEALRQSFLGSGKLWDHMRFLIAHGSMYLRRDDNLILHGCVPVDDQGELLPMLVDGKPYRGRALFEALEGVITRVRERASDSDRDLMWYLWCGPLSPLFGKDRITTLENDLVADPATRVENKNPFFQLIHDAAFCERILREFGVDPERGLIVNGHVPVKVEKGESPLKRSGKAITIDGAFSEAYGDHGYTLVLEPEHTLLARHHHFQSVQAAVREGVDIIPTVSVLREWSPPRRVADTERGAAIRQEIRLLERLLQAYRTNQIRPAQW